MSSKSKKSCWRAMALASHGQLFNTRPRFFALGGCNLVLFHVLTSVPEFFCDFGPETENEAIINTKGGKIAPKKSMESFIKKSREGLIREAILGRAINAGICPRGAGFARDILSKSKRGYHALALQSGQVSLPMKASGKEEEKCGDLFVMEPLAWKRR